METTRQKKIGRLLQKELAEIFRKDNLHLFGGAMVSVSHVWVAPDLSLAKVYLSIFPVDDKDAFIHLVRSKTVMIRKELAGIVRHQLRKIPELSFYIDDTIDRMEEIDRLLKGGGDAEE